MIDVVLVRRAPYDDDPAFPLAPGPISPLDPATFLLVLPRPALVDLVAQALASTSGHHTAIDTAHQTIVEHSQPTRLTAASSASLEPAIGAHAAHAGAFDQADPVSVIETTNSHGALIDGAQHGYDQETPPDLAPVDPGDRPGRGDDGDAGRV